mgnify:CR=1 FL=1
MNADSGYCHHKCQSVHRVSGERRSVTTSKKPQLDGLIDSSNPPANRPTPVHYMMASRCTSAMECAQKGADRQITLRALLKLQIPTKWQRKPSKSKRDKVQYPSPAAEKSLGNFKNFQSRELSLYKCHIDHILLLHARTSRFSLNLVFDAFCSVPFLLLLLGFVSGDL